jgi:hypothetical protein
MMSEPNAVTPPLHTYTAAPMSASSPTCGSRAASASCAHSIPYVRSAPPSSRRASAARSAGEKSQPVAGAREGESGRSSARSTAQPIVSAPATMYLRASRLAAGQRRESSRLVHVLPRRERAVHVPDGEVEQPGEDREESGRGVPDAEAYRELGRLVPSRGHCRTCRSAGGGTRFGRIRTEDEAGRDGALEDAEEEAESDRSAVRAQASRRHREHAPCEDECRERAREREPPQQERYRDDADEVAPVEGSRAVCDV